MKGEIFVPISEFAVSPGLAETSLSRARKHVSIAGKHSTGVWAKS